MPLAVAVGVACAGVPSLQAQEMALPLLEAASAKYQASTTLCADFEQRLSVPLLGEESTGRGRLCQRQPDLFGMRFSDPEGDAVVVDGVHVWIYYPSMDEKTVIRFGMADSPGGFDFHREFLERPAEKYDLTYETMEMVAGQPTHRILLIPREDDSYRSAKLWIDVEGSLLRQVQVVEENDSVRTLTLESVELGAVVPDSWFVFELPEGAQVIAR